MHKNPMYACFGFFQDGSVKRWKYVSNLESFRDFLNRDHPTWKYFNVYDKGSKEYLKRFYPGQAVPKLLMAFLIFMALMHFSRPSTTYENTFDKTTFINGFNNTATIPTLSTQRGGLLC